MYKILYFSDSYKHFDTSIKEYEKRLGGVVEMLQIKPSKAKDTKTIVAQETEILMRKLQELKGRKILLIDTGKTYSTSLWYEHIEHLKQHHSDIVFVIGGAYGVDENILEGYIDESFSLSKMTYPHNLAYLVLLEQIYRIEMMKKGSKYHH